MDNDLYEALIGAELSGRELRVALAIHRQTAGYNMESACIAASYIAQMSGIRREDVSRAISELLRQGVINREGGSRSPIGFAPVGEWKIDKKNTHPNKPKGAPQCGVSSTSNVAFLPHNKERNTNTTPDGVVADAERQPVEPKATRQKLTVDACPYQAIVDLYHQALPELPAVAILNPGRKRTLQSRWRESDVHRDLGFWADYFFQVKTSDFLMGRVPGRNGSKAFRATFDWLIAPSNFVKVVEGNYHA
ncbi:phage replication protein O [Pseudomonas alkylphenolica]|uniref:Phage replication protein O n=2 Tax=Pseudomonas alkylphenolica TaxID=237609 RepID=A0A077F947_9PSED|nr:phage replication protein O [Pseudomonas alkylphenolica]